MVNNIDVIGANGVLGSVVCDYLDSRNIKYRKVTSSRTIDSISFEDYLKTDLGKIILDLSLMKIEDAIELRLKLDISEESLFVHFSSISADIDSGYYGSYKLSTYRIFKGYELFFPVKGDLFTYKNRVLGYWNYIDFKSMFIFSFRIIKIFKIENLADKILLNEIYHPEILNTYILPKWTIIFMLKSRLNKVLRFFKIYIIK